MSGKPHVLIAGAGIGGLTAALSLLQRGFDVDIYEQATELKEVGLGLQIGANGTRVLHALGLEAPLKEIGCEPSGKIVRLWNGDLTRKVIDLGQSSIERYGARYYTVLRSEFHGMLVAAVEREKPHALHLNSYCTGCDQSETRAALHLKNGERVSGDVLIGADGVHSCIREGLFGPGEPQYTGIIAWRGLVPTAGLSSGIVRSGGVFWVGPRAHVIHYPVRKGGELLSFVGHVEHEDWREESWSARGTHADCLADFKGWHDDVQELIRNVVVPYKLALVVRDPMSSWSAGRVTLVGDACHATLPFLAQGANMALEDGFILARCLEKYWEDVPTALNRYERARIERANTVIRQSAAQAQTTQDNALADPVSAEKHMAQAWDEKRTHERYDWLYEYDAITTPID